MSAIDILKKLPAAFNAEDAGDTSCVIQFNSLAYTTIQNGKCEVTEGTAPNADMTIKMEDEDLVELLKGELNGMTAFMTGKLQVEGDLMLAQKMTSFFDPSKLA